MAKSPGDNLVPALLGLPREMRNQIYSYLSPPTPNKVFILGHFSVESDGYLPRIKLRLLEAAMADNIVDIPVDDIHTALQAYNDRNYSRMNAIVHRFSFVKPTCISLYSARRTEQYLHGGVIQKYTELHYFDHKVLLDINRQIRAEVIDYQFRNRMYYCNDFIPGVTRAFCSVPPFLEPIMNHILLGPLATRVAIQYIRQRDIPSSSLNVLLHLWKYRYKLKTLEIGDEYMLVGFSQAFSELVTVLATIPSLERIQIRFPTHYVSGSCMSAELKEQERDLLLSRIQPTGFRLASSGEDQGSCIVLERPTVGGIYLDPIDVKKHHAIPAGKGHIDGADEVMQGAKQENGSDIGTRGLELMIKRSRRLRRWMELRRRRVGPFSTISALFQQIVRDP